MKILRISLIIYHLFIIPPLITELIEELGKSGDINNLRNK